MKDTQPNMEEGTGYLDLTALSRYSSIGKSTLRQHIKNGDLPAYRPGGKLLVKKETFDRWVEGHAYEPKDLNALVDDALAVFGN